MRGKGACKDNSQATAWSGRKTLKSCKGKGKSDGVILIDVDSDDCDDVIIIDVPKSLQQKIRGRYGLDPDSERCSSESDCSDCEVLDGSFKELREQWEKASQKRKYNLRNGQSRVEDQASASTSPSDRCPNVGVENRTELHTDAHVCSSSASFPFEKESNSTSVPASGRGLGGNFNSEVQNPFVKSDQRNDNGRYSWSEGWPWQKLYCERKNDASSGGETVSEDPCKSYKHFSNCGAGFQDKQESSQGPSLWSNKEVADDQHCHQKTSPDEEQNFMGYHCNIQPGNVHFDHRKASFRDEDASLGKDCRSGGTNVNEKVESSEKDEGLCQVQSSCMKSARKSSHERAGFNGIGAVFSGGPVSKPQSSNDTQVQADIAHSEDEFRVVCETSYACKTPPCGSRESSSEKDDCLDIENPDSEEVDGMQIKKGGSQLAEEKEPFINSFTNGQPRDESGSLCDQGGNVRPGVQGDVINDREKLKETDEYKRAVEKEWASRQRQLQIQAEEAQRLRKRRKAESMRLLDMERRQKQRLEEVRETQKKDEEYINQKEQLRVEVRKNLHKLEMTCIDMASLLRGLGISVGGGFCPAIHEVHAAYKRALLKFHPDRASRTDIRQQVESEEKFKLISRMKEKFLSTS